MKPKKTLPTTSVPDDFKPNDRNRAHCKKYGLEDPDTPAIIDDFINRNQDKGILSARWNARYNWWMDNRKKWGLAGPSRRTPGIKATGNSEKESHYDVEKSKKWFKDLQADLVKKKGIT